MIRLLLILLAFAAPPASAQDVVVGSKKFTESVILGEIVAQTARTRNVAATHRREIGGTRILWEALRRGDIDVYPEYTGTISREILGDADTSTTASMAVALAERGIAMTGPLGFNNTYALGVLPATAERFALRKISDLRRHPALAIGFSNEFLNRGDGWAGLRERYGLPHDKVRGLDHDLAYRGLAASRIDVTDVYTTDAEIAYYGLVLLDDDLAYFPVYDAVLLYRTDLLERAPRLVSAFVRLEGAMDAALMSSMNARAKIDRETETAIASQFVSARFGATDTTPPETMLDRLWQTTLDHLALVAISLGAAIAIAVPLGIVAARRPAAGQIVLGAVGILQTVPSLALFVFMIPLLGIGGPPAVMALFLYSQLPIVRNTHAGLAGIDPATIESANALGLEPRARLRMVELPLAMRSIMAGIKTAAVINVGTATLGALIGAGGYGQPILTGIRLDDTSLILEGAVPAALLALAVQGLFELAERAVVPRGLRMHSTR
ncbi:MAG: glycine betaine ABC transporter substrate-binding protein [Rhodospirillaceae bacterium]